MDYGKAFSFVFKDPDWVKKILLGGVWILLSGFIVPIFIASGYMVKLARNVRAGLENPLPEWDDYGKLIMDGIYLAIIGFVYNIPASVLSLLGRKFAIFNILGSLYGLLIFFVLIPAYVNFIKKGELSAGFEFDFIIAFISKYFAEILITALCLWGAYIIAGFGVLALVIGVIFTAFWAMTVMGHLLGQLSFLPMGEYDEGI